MGWPWGSKYDELSDEAKSRKKFAQWLVFANTLGLTLFVLVVIWATLLKKGGISTSTVPGVIGIHATVMVLFVIYMQGISKLSKSICKSLYLTK